MLCPSETHVAAPNRVAMARQAEKTVFREKPTRPWQVDLINILVTDSHIRPSNRIQRSPDGPPTENPQYSHRSRRVSLQERRGRGHLCGKGEEPAQPRRQLFL